MKIRASMLAAAILAGSVARAQTATIVSSAEIRAIVSRPDTAVAYDSLVHVSRMDGYNVGVAAVRRSRVGDKTPPDALSHHDITEVYHIVEGHGVFVSGGTIVNGAEMAADSRAVRRVVGPSERGIGIRGGTSRSVAAGDVIVVPPNTPHGFSELGSERVVYVVVRVDPRGVLPVSPP